MSLRSKLAKLKKLLLARDSALIVQGVELAVATEDPEVIDTLLDGVTYDPDRDLRRDYEYSTRPHRRFRGGLAPNKIFKGSGPAQPFHDLAVLGLVSLATAGDRAPELREKLVSLVIGSANEKGRPVLPLRLLAGLDRLVDLRVEANNDVADIGVLAGLPRLARLQLDLDFRCALVGGLAGLGASASLRNLEIEARRLESLDGLEGGRLTDLEVDGETLEDIEAIRGLPIERLILRKCRIREVGAIGALPRLERVELHDCGALESVAGLAGSRVREVVIEGFRDGLPVLDAVDLPALVKLQVRTHRLAELGDLRGITALETLHIGGWGQPMDLRLAQPLPRLRSLKLWGPATSIGDASWYPALRELDVLDPTDLDEIARLEGLRRFELGGRKHQRLDALPSVKVKKLDLSRCEQLTSIRGLGSLRGLERLRLQGCTSLASLAGLETLDRLRLLDLRGCSSLSDVSALRSVTSLRAVLVDGCPLEIGDFPEAIRWCISGDRFPIEEELLERRPPAKEGRGPVPEALSPVWDAIERSLSAPSYEAMNRIADIARDAGSAPLYDALLFGTTYRRSRLEAGPRLGRKPKLLKRHLVRRLVAEAPADSSEAAALREAVTRLEIRGRRFRKKRIEEAPVDLAPLAGFPNLERVSVKSVEASDNAAVVASLPGLRELDINQTREFTDLRFLGASPVRALSLGSAISLAGVERLPDLERLSVSTWEYVSQVRDLATLAGARGLRSLALGCERWADLDPLFGLTGLTELSLSAPQLTDLSPLSALENLESLSLGAGAVDLRGLRLPKLRELTLRPAPGLQSLAGAELPSLVSLTVDQGRELVELGELPPTLQAIKLHTVPTSADLSAIGRAPRLWHVWLLAGTRHDLSFLAGGAPIERLEIHNGRVRDVSATAACPTLVQLALPYNNVPVDLAPLAGHPGLRSVRVPSSYVDRSATPETVRALLSPREHIDDFEPR